MSHILDELITVILHTANQITIGKIKRISQTHSWIVHHRKQADPFHSSRRFYTD
ncbi:hypothetical protein D3C84_1202640 [compost metagenome]